MKTPPIPRRRSQTGEDSALPSSDLIAKSRDHPLRALNQARRPTLSFRSAHLPRLPFWGPQGFSSQHSLAFRADTPQDRHRLPVTCPGVEHPRPPRQRATAPAGSPVTCGGPPPTLHPCGAMDEGPLRPSRSPMPHQQSSSLSLLPTKCLRVRILLRGCCSRTLNAWSRGPCVGSPL